MNKRLESFLAWLVAMVFSIAAVFVVWFLSVTFTRHYEARSWVAVTAETLNYDIRTSRTHRATSLMPIIQERLVTAYTYTYENRPYEGNRVDFSIGSDNFSGTRRSQQLAVLRSGHITVYVNPVDPRDSVFDRSLPGNQVVFAIVFLIFPCGVGTAFFFGMLSAGLGKLGFKSIERYYLPLLGIFHSAPALYPALFDPQSIGPGGWVIMIAFIGLLGVSLRSVWRRMRDPSIGNPQWSERFRTQMGRSTGPAMTSDPGDIETRRPEKLD